MNCEKLKTELTLEEGERLVAYLDTKGILTVGVGHNCVAKPVEGVTQVGDRITPEKEKALFLADCDDAIAQLDKRLPWWSTLDDVRQNVLLDMCFNMGINTLSSFVNTLHAIETGDYSVAVVGMRSSKWATQVGSRAVRLEKMMLTGEWPTDV